MYARITQLKVSADQIEPGTKTFKERIVPAAGKLPGFLGATLVVDREQGLAAGSTFWDTVQSMNAAEEMGIQARIDSAEATGGEIIDVDRFDLPVVDRPTGAATSGFMRVNQFAGDPANIEKGIAFIRDKVVPNVSSQPGYKSLVLAINRMTGRGLVVTTWESEAARDASEPAVSDQRRTAGEIFGGPVKVTFAEVLHAEVKQPAGV